MMKLVLSFILPVALVSCYKTDEGLKQNEYTIDFNSNYILGRWIPSDTLVFQELVNGNSVYLDSLHFLSSRSARIYTRINDAADINETTWNFYEENNVLSFGGSVRKIIALDSLSMQLMNFQTDEFEYFVRP